MSYQIRKLDLSYNCEVFINTNTQVRFYFDDSVLMMDQVLVHGIFMPTRTVKSPSFRDVMPVLTARSGYLTLMSYNNHLYNNDIPLYIMRKKLFSRYDELGEGNEILFVKPKLISLRNSYVTFPAISSYGIPATGYALPFTFFYEKYDPAIHKINSWGELINDTN